MNGGFVMIPRIIEKTCLMSNAELLGTYTYLAIKANYKDNNFFFNGQEILIKRGQLLTSQSKIASDMMMSRSKITRILCKLSELGYIEQQTNSRFTIITLTYYGYEEEGEPQKNRRKTAEKPQKNTIEEINKGIKEKEDKEKDISLHSISKKKVDQKISFGQFKNVKMTQEEYDKLVERFTATVTDHKIETLSEYLESTGKRYKSHYATILTWDRSNKAKRPFRSTGGKYVDEEDRIRGEERLKKWLAED